MISETRAPGSRRAMSPLWAMLTLLMVLPALSSAGGGSPPWKAAAVRGEVAAMPPGVTPVSWSRLERGEMLAPGSLVRTGTRARTTLVHPSAVILVDPDSRITLPDPEHPRRVVQSRGRVLYRVKKEGRGFRVETPALVAGVKGTTFMVAVDAKRASVWVEEGRVEVFSPETGETEELEAGERFIIERDAAEDGRWVRVDASGPDGTRKDEARPDRRESRFLDRALKRLARDLESDVRAENGDEDSILMADDDSLSGEPTRLDDSSLEGDEGTADDPTLLEDLDEEADRVRTGTTGSGGSGGSSGSGGNTGRVPADPRNADLPESSTPPGVS